MSGQHAGEELEVNSSEEFRLPFATIRCRLAAHCTQYLLSSRETRKGSEGSRDLYA